MADMVEVVIDSIRVSLMSQQRIVILRESNADRYLPIWIGVYEAESITIALQEVEVARPLTHDLVKNIFQQLNARVLRVEVVALRDDTYYGNIVAEVDGRTLHIDSRPSDALALAVRTHVPILVARSVRGLRLLTMLIIPFSLCSARLQVFVFLTTAVFSPGTAPFVLFSLYVMSFFAAFLTALLYRRRLPNNEPLLLELPPYRFLTGRQMVNRGWHEAKHFVRDAGGFILLGVVAVWLLTHVPFAAVPASADTLAGQIAGWMAPAFAPLGIDNLMSIALLFGFVAKEVVVGALAVIYGTSRRAASVTRGPLTVA